MLDTHLSNLTASNHLVRECLVARKQELSFA